MDNDAVSRPAMNFDDIVKMAEAAIHEAVTAPPSELVAVKSKMGGFEMRVQRVSLLDRLLSTN